MPFYRTLLIVLLLMLPGNLFANHFYGVDLFYTHVSGNTYKVTLVAFGDCSGTTFPTFSNATPTIHVRRDNVDVEIGNLVLEPPTEGIEVTPVCPEELNNTTCKNPSGSVPGVTKFVYSKEFTLSGPAPDWKFVFLGVMSSSVNAGRSVSLTNITIPGLITLEATLDNTQFANSSPVYTTIATPFYCNNRPTNFNPGAVDADGDSLVYELVPGMDGISPLPYASGFSGSNPLDVSPGAFSFSRSTGQLNFTPAQIQKALVVYKVSEYRNGVLLGTSMREMTVVIMDCGNNPPAGYITEVSGATIVDKVTVKTCNGSHEVAFDIDPTDADGGDSINMVVNGLPQNASLNITNNNTTNPQGRFVWNMPDLPEGDYTFFVTYTDNGCPIASKQTQAYTIRIKHDEIFAEASSADCSDKGLVKVTVPADWSPWFYEILEGTTSVYTKDSITTTSADNSMAPGVYKIEARNTIGCKSDAMVEVVKDCFLADLPNAFSPNNDGHNDILLVRGEGIADVHLKVYNRWGQVVFESHELNQGWDGKYNGIEAPVEAYAYVLSIGFRNGQTFQKQGNITLLR